MSSDVKFDGDQAVPALRKPVKRRSEKPRESCTIQSCAKGASDFSPQMAPTAKAAVRRAAGAAQVQGRGRRSFLLPPVG
eukprot:6174808-Pleurochrysis_carterae.AAC.1